MILAATAMMLRMFQRVMFGEADREANRGMPDLSGRELAVLLPLVALIVWIGVYPLLSRADGGFGGALRRARDRSAGAADRGLAVTPEPKELIDAYRAVRPALFPVLPAAILTVFGLLALVVDVRTGPDAWPGGGRRGDADHGPYLAIVGTVAGLGAVVWQALRLPRAAGEYFNGMIVLDGFGVFLSGVVLAGTFLTLLLTVGYCRRHDINLAEYYHLILMAAVGMLFMVQANNLIMIFASLEPMSVAVYVLTGFRRTRLR